jgi:hypothetical protein
MSDATKHARLHQTILPQGRLSRQPNQAAESASVVYTHTHRQQFNSSWPRFSSMNAQRVAVQTPHHPPIPEPARHLGGDGSKQLSLSEQPLTAAVGDGDGSRTAAAKLNPPRHTVAHQLRECVAAAAHRSGHRDTLARWS